MKALDAKVSATQRKLTLFAFFRAFWPFLVFVASFLATAIAGGFDRLVPALGAVMALTFRPSEPVPCIAASRSSLSFGRSAARAARAHTHACRLGDDTCSAFFLSNRVERSFGHFIFCLGLSV